MPSEKVSLLPSAKPRQADDSSRAGVRLLGMRGGLVLGFGGLLVLLILSGLSALHALAEFHSANETTLQEFLAKNRQTEDIRDAVYLSGTLVRDYLLEPDRNKAEQSRRELLDEYARIQTLLAAAGSNSNSGDHENF